MIILLKEKIMFFHYTMLTNLAELSPQMTFFP